MADQMTPEAAFVQQAVNPNVNPGLTEITTPPAESPLIVAEPETSTVAAAQPGEGVLPGASPVDADKPQQADMSLDPRVLEFAGTLLKNGEQPQSFPADGQNGMPDGQTSGSVPSAAGETPAGGVAAAAPVEAAATPDAVSAGDGSLFASSESAAINPTIPDNLNSQENAPSNISNFSEVVSRMKKAKEREIGLIGRAGDLLTIATDTNRTDEQKVQDVVTMLDEQMAA